MRILFLASCVILFTTGLLIGIVAQEFSASEIPLTAFLEKISGGNLVTPVAIAFSASIAAITAYVTLNKHDLRESKKWTLDALTSSPFTWAGIRENSSFLKRLREMSASLDDDAFHKEMTDRRNDGCEKLHNVVLFIDAYQQLAIGIDSGLYDEDTAKAICKNQLAYFFKHSERYIHWRRTRIDEITGPAGTHSYKEFLLLVRRWGNKLEYCTT